MDLDYGDVPTWLAGLGAFVAVAYAKRAADATRAMLAVEAKRDAERTASEAKQQAELVYAWWALDGSGDDIEGAWVRNASHLPVYDIEVEFYLRLPRRGKSPQRTFKGREAIVTPDERPTFVEREPATLDDMEAGAVRTNVVAFTFRDSAGHRWRRDVDGRLSRLVDE